MHSVIWTILETAASLLLTGHIIWRISDFEAKMTDAKENNTVLRSPVFYSSQHGYKLRVNTCMVLCDAD